MTHISKRTLKKENFDALYNEAISILAKTNERNGHGFFNELLSLSEKVMLTKRLCAIAMLHKGESTYRVAHTLLMSPSTTDRIGLAYERGAYRHITKLLVQTSAQPLLKLIDELLLFGMPPRGKGRWRALRNLN